MTGKIFTKLKVLKTKHILCKARINGKKAKLLVDTGASNSCIHSDLQDYFKLQKDGEPFQASGASEGKMEAIMTLNCNIKLGRNYIELFWLTLGLVTLPVTILHKISWYAVSPACAKRMMGLL